MPGEKWSPEGKGILKQLFEADKSIDDILKVFPSRTKHAVNSQIAAMGLVRPYKAEFDIKEFNRLMGKK